MSMPRPKLEDSKGMLLDGIFSSSLVDSSGEVVSIQGMDISSLEEGKSICNYEHLSAADGAGKEVVGRVVFARKILSSSDCETEREKFFYKKNLNKPYLYGVVRLFDAAGHKEAQDIAALVRDYVAHGEPLLLGFSIEGSTVTKEGNLIKESIARKVALTLQPCCKAAIADVILDPAPPDGFEKIDRTSMAKAEVLQDPLNRKIGGAVELEYNPIYGSDRELCKSVSDLPKGKEIPVVSSKMKASRSYDYSSLLTPEQTNLGYTLRVDRVGSSGSLRSVISHRGKEVGEVFGETDLGSVTPHSEIKESHRGKGLGVKAYEALYSHAKHVEGIDRVIGGSHTESAHRVHLSLAKKHGFRYDPRPRRTVSDAVWGDYGYSLKSEIPTDALDESRLEPVVFGNSKNSLAKNIAVIKILKKALTAGTADAAPSCLTGGAALQKEDVGKKYRGSVLAAARDFDQPWDRPKFKKHLKEYLSKAQLPEISDSFIDHFTDIAEAWKLKKSIDDLDLESLKKKEKPVLASPSESVIEDDRDNIPATPKALTFRGKKLRPLPTQKSVDLDPKNGVLKTPYGAFRLHNPATEAPDIAQHFQNCLNSTHTYHIMSQALSNWHKVHQLNKAGELPEEIPMTATILSTCSGNRPVPLTELQTVRIVDAMRNSGIDIRNPGFENIMPHLRELDKPDVLPVTGRDYIANDPDYFTESGSLRSINPLLQDTVSNLSEYYKAHRGLVDLVGKHRVDMSGAIRELMEHKRLRGNWQDRRAAIQKETGTDPGEYKGLNIPGIKLKTGLYAYGMMGGGTSIVPDTHFIRHMVGLDVRKDADTLKYLKKALWEPTNYHVIEKYNDWYRRNHPAFQWMVNHPEFGKYFENPEDATFPAFWANWINVPAYEEALGTFSRNKAKNSGSTHAPYWAAIEPHVNAALKRLGKSEDFDSTMPLRAALIMQHYVKDFGEIPAQLLYYTHLVPKLLECAQNRQNQSDASSFLRKSIQLESELIELRKSMRHMLAGDESVEMPELYRVGLQHGDKVNPAGRFMVVNGKLHHLEDYHGVLQNMLPEGDLNASTISKIHGMMASPHFEVKEHIVEPEQEMDRQPLIPTVVKLPQPKRDAVFTYYRPGMAKPHTVEFNEHGAALDGHAISSDELTLMLENARKGLAAIKWGANAVLKKHETEGLMETDAALQHIRTALGDDHPSVKALTKAIYEDDMVGGIGNKRAAIAFRAKNKPGVYASIDANDFKHINDVHGHDAGDDAIKSFGGALREASKKVGTTKVFRTGGDELAVWSPTFEHMAQFLRHARNNIDALPAIGGTHKQSLSVGLGHNFEKADKAMYLAKARKLDPVTKQKLYQPGQTPHLGYSLVPGQEGEIFQQEPAPPKVAVE